MSELIEDLMMLADKCSEDDPADELGLLLVRAVGQIRGDAYAIAAKDARIAELEQKIIGLEDAFASNLDYRAMYRQLRAQLASQQQAEPLIDTSAWQSCNPGCDPEFNGEKGRHCVCDPAKAAMSAKKANSINPEMVDVVGYTTAGMLRISKDLPLTGRIGAKCKPDERWNVPLMTVAQCKRIVAAKDAEIARLRQHKNDYMEAAEETARALRNEINDHQEEIRRLDALVAELRAQPARQVGGDEWRCFYCDEHFTDKEQAALHFGTSLIHNPACQIDIAEYRAMESRMERYNEEDADIHRSMYRMQNEHNQALRREEEKGYARGLKDAALDPAAVTVVLPSVEQAMKAVMAKYYGEPCPHIKGTSNWCAEIGKAVLDEVARLNRNPIPVELLKRSANLLDARICTGCAESEICCRPEVRDTARELRALLGKDEGSQ